MAFQVIDNLLVVIDTAKLSIKLITDFNTSIVKDLIQRQKFLQVVEYNSAKVSDAKKALP